jgi:uncharacterized protein (TIGR02680 family)
MATDVTSRWKPLRAGIFNIWEYDDQVFDFGDGRLVIRGRNGSGKSNALSLLFPFLLDGVMSAARMDPMGGARSMKSLLLGRDEDETSGSSYRYESGTGYVWMEFTSTSRSAGPDSEVRFMTIGVGAAATQQREASPWFFVTTRRVGHDFELHHADVPKGQRQLTESIGPESVFDTAEDYRNAVDRALFGLGGGRYKTLVDLLLTLRRPHLAAKLDTEHLSGTLSAGLAELDPTLIDDVAHSFDDLDAMHVQLEGLTTASNAVERFLPIYRDHLLGVARQRSEHLTDAHAEHARLERDLAKALADRTGTEAELVRHTAAVEFARAERRRFDTVIDTIKDSPAYQSAVALAEVDKQARLAAQHAAQARQLADQLDSQTADLESAAIIARSAVAEIESELHTLITDWIAHARSAGVESAQLDARFDNDLATRLVTERNADVTEIEHAARSSEEAGRIAEAAEARRGQAECELAEAGQQLDAALTALAAEAEALDHLRAMWAVDADHVVERVAVVTGSTFRPVGAAWADGDPNFQTSIRLSSFFEHVALGLAAAQLAAEALQTESHRVVDALADERQRVSEEPNPGPPPNRTRPGAVDAERPGAPLYVCVDFVDTINDQDRAGLEAALDAAGLLDARVVPASVSAADGLDAVLLPVDRPVASPTLADLLIPVPTADLDAKRISEVLRAIPLADDIVMLGHDGRWRLGPLVGRFAQPSAQFIGHAARERRRLARLDEIDRQLDEARAAAERADTDVTSLAEIAGQLGVVRRDEPPDSDMHTARRNVDVADGAVHDRRQRFEQAGIEAAELADRAQMLSVEVHRRAAAVKLPVSLNELGAFRSVLSECRQQQDTIGLQQRHLTKSSAAADSAELSRTSAAATSGQQRNAAATATGDAETAAQRYQLLQAQHGADAQSAIDDLAEAGEGRTASEQAEQRSLEQQAEAKSLIATLDERRKQLETRLVTSTSHVDLATGAFGVIRSSEVVSVIAVDGIDVGMTARDAARRLLAGTTAVGPDATNDMEKAYRTILLDGLRSGHDPSMPKLEGFDVVRVGTVDGEVPIGILASQLRSDRERLDQLLSDREREIFENYLLTGIGDALRKLLLDADHFEQTINTEMAKVPTESKLTVELKWELDTDDRLVRQAVDTLRFDPTMVSPERRDQLRAFFTGRIADLRAADPGRGFVEILTEALDYRTWHRFTMFVRFADGGRRRVTRALYRQLSGGEAATVLHLPLFAAAAAHYASGALAGPRIIALDEAFAGIDDQMRGRLMGLLVQLDLDVILTSHEFWGFYDQVPNLVLYDLTRKPPTPGVFAQRLAWSSDVR